MRFFRTRFLGQAHDFIASLDKNAAKKLLYNIDNAEQTNDPRLFKKLKDEIWEFRVRYRGIQIRLLAFWDKTDNQNTLVFATHGFVKKTDKAPGHEIERAKNIRKKYFETKK
jgi:phage-related protein